MKKAKQKKTLHTIKGASALVDHNQVQAKIPRGRKWFFISILTLIVPVCLLLLLELCLRIAGYGYPTDFFIKREIQGQEYYTDNPQFSLQFFPSQLARPSSHLAIPLEKPSNTCRIVVLGGSAAMGDPDFSFGFSRMLERMLRYEVPDRRIEVINVAITAINSNVVLPIARDCAKLQPDLFVVYLGNNEVIGPYGPGTVFAPFQSSLGFIHASIFLNSTKTGQLLRSLREKFVTNEDDVRVWGGVDMFTENRLRFDDPRMAAVYDHFRENLIDICNAGRKAGAEVIVSAVSTNLKNCAPFGSLHRQDLTGAELQEWQTNYRAAIDLESSGKLEQAISFYLTANDIDDEFADLQFRLARCYFALEDYEKAHDYFTRARDLDALRFRADSQIDAIIREIAAGDGDPGISFVDAERDLGAEGVAGIPGIHLFYDHVHFNFTGNYLLARVVKQQVQRVLDVESNGQVLSETECAESLAFTPWDSFRMEKEILDRMKSPAFANQLDNAAQVRIASAKLDSIRAFLKPDAFTEAAEVYRRAIAANQQDWILHNNFGLLLLEAGDDPAGAIEQFMYVRRLFPQDHLTYNNLGLAYARQDKINQAIASYREALRIKPGFSKACINLGEALERQGKYDEAMRYYQEANLPPEGLANVHNRYGIRLSNEGKVDEAIQQFSWAIDLSPGLPDPHRNLGKVYAHLGKRELAIQHLLRAVTIEPERTEGHVELGSLLFMQGKFKEAAENYSKALQIKPDLPEVQNNLALAFCKLGEFDEAVPHFQMALSIRPDCLAARNNLAGALSQLGRGEEAIAVLRESLRINPNDPSAHNNIGAELLKQGRVEEAITHFQKSLKLNPDSEGARKNLNYALSRLSTDDGKESSAQENR